MLVPAGVAWGSRISVVGAVNDRSNDGTRSPSSTDKDDSAGSVPAIPGPCDPRQRFLAVANHAPCSSVPRLQPPPRYVPFVPVQAGTWFIASFFHVTLELNARNWVEQYSAYGVLAARYSRLDVGLGAEPRLCQVVKLLFKSRAAAAILISLLVNDAKSFLNFDSFTVLHDTSWKIVAQYERVFWLPFIDQVYAQALYPDDFKFLLGRAPLHPHASHAEFRWKFLGQKGPNDPLTVPLKSAAAVQLCTPRYQRRRRLDAVEFDCEWLTARASAGRVFFGTAEWLELRYLVIMLRGHSYGGLSKRWAQFVVGMWPTEDG